MADHALTGVNEIVPQISMAAARCGNTSKISGTPVSAAESSGVWLVDVALDCDNMDLELRTGIMEFPAFIQLKIEATGERVGGLFLVNASSCPSN
jgi:hypothetical protein